MLLLELPFNSNIRNEMLNFYFFLHINKIQTRFKLHGRRVEVLAQQTVGELVVEGGGVHHTDL